MPYPQKVQEAAIELQLGSKGDLKHVLTRLESQRNWGDIKNQQIIHYPFYIRQLKENKGQKND